jgi:3-methyladenine DNA glycosylase/8-oxoguanine DNA glycosylase
VAGGRSRPDVGPLLNGRVSRVSPLAAQPEPGPAGPPGPPDPSGLAAGTAHPGVMLTGRWEAPYLVDLARTLGVHRRGKGDPSFRVEPSGTVWRTSRTPLGPATMRLTAARDGDGSTVRTWAWGPGAAWLIASLPALLGADDDKTGFQPAHPVLAELDRRYPHLRIGRSGRVFEALVPAVLEQKVVGTEAKRAWRTLMLKFGEPPPGPAPRGMRVFPPPRTWARIPSWDWHRAGVEGVRAKTVIGAARVAGRLEEIVAMTPAEADRRLRSLPGIGPWTSAEIRQRACGDPDAVSVGDLHLPGAVGWALAGQKVDDAGMLELLAPYPGHRHRAARLVVLSGIHPPRHGPRNAPRDYRAI